MSSERLPEPLRQRFRDLAAELQGVDAAAYERFGRDPLEPVIGLGRAAAPLCFFGRDPGRDEIRHGEPFVGSGGQLVRRVLHRHLHGSELADFEASLAVGRPYFWVNTVPYKPLGNKAWPMAVKKRFRPLVCESLATWKGRDVMTFGREAFAWFGIDQPGETRRLLEAFWRREDRFSADLPLSLVLPDGASRDFVLHPLPHPSPLNRTWLKRFPGLFEARLKALEGRASRS